MSRTFAIRASAVFFAVWLGLLLISRVIRISPDWPLWLVAATAAAAVEFILALYRYEAGAVTPRRARWIIGLRLAALAVIGWMLIEPTWVREVAREPRRKVVLLLDESASMDLKDAGAAKSRLAIGQEALAAAKVVEKLSGPFDVPVMHAARSVRAEGEAARQGWNDATDLAAALGTVLDQVPPAELAGVVMVTDGRHNRPARVEDVARRFGILDAPVGILAVGDPNPPRDAAIIAVRAPDSIHLGDRMRVEVDAKFDGYKGGKAKVVLRQGDTILEEREIQIPQDRHREEIRFARVPEEGGVGEYTVEIAALENETFADNNRWNFETAITDARTHVLIIENQPRWEFRYLRNLFYGRDKSVHLQYVLLQPDRIAGQTDPPVHASASRPFGEARASRQPQTSEEWRKFDVIILGDLPPKALGDLEWLEISRSVRDRGALLVMVAGPRYFPRTITSAIGRELVPAEMDWGNPDFLKAVGEPFRFNLTAEGERHPVTRQSVGETANRALWQGFPTIQWRHPITALKDGAEVLLTAADPAEDAAVSSASGLDAALSALAERRQRETEAALLVTRQTGKGKVALLLTDRTWRLREGAGDVHHHRFWGNLIRWGAGPILRAGGERARLGTDQLTYTPDDRPRVTARLRDGDLRPVESEELRAEITRDGEVLAKVPLLPVKDAAGLFEAELERCREPGRYEVRLSGDPVDRLVKEDGRKELMTSFRVVGTHGPVELADTTPDPALMETIATLSGGKVVPPDHAGGLAELFLTDKTQRTELRETTLWDNALLLLLLAGLLGGEWVLRRSGGLP
jgi:hypothetical protein